MSLLDGRQQRAVREVVMMMTASGYNDRCVVCGSPQRWDAPRQSGWEPLKLLHKGRDDKGPFEDWANTTYKVTKRRWKKARMTSLMISRCDGSAERDWRDYQAIKNQLLGEQAEAVELYPAERRKVDPSNAFFLWAPDKGLEQLGWRVPRTVLGPGNQSLAPQRRFARDGP